jgi:hypothetical protein
MQKNRRRRTGICTLWRNLGKEEETGEVLKVDTGCIVGFTKDVDYDIDSLAESRTPFRWRRSVLRHPFEALAFTYNFTFSRLLTELLLQHLKQEEIVKEVY